MIYKFDSKEAKKKYVEEVKEYSDIRFRVTDPIPDRKDVNWDYIRLGYKITDRIGWINGASSEYYGLSHMITPEQAKIGLKLKKMKRFTVDDLLKKLPQYTRESLDEQLFDMACRGFLEYGYNDKGERLYVVPPVIVGMGEWGALHSYLDNPVSKAIKHRTMVNFFDRNGYIPIGQLGSMIAPGNSGIGMHVVPVEQEVNASNVSVPVEHLSYHLDRVDKYSAMPCVCRVTHTILDNNGSVDDPDDWCIGLGTFADYVAETGKGRRISREEAEEIIQRAEDNGFVHQITAQEGGDGAYIICNCDKNACLAIRSSQLFNTPNMSRSSYTAKVNQDNCVACGGCVEICPAGAVKLGQRLKYKDGTSPEFPVSDCVDNHIIWDKSKWDIYWRDTHRTNCYDMGTAPCKTACPAHIAVEGYVKLRAVMRKPSNSSRKRIRSRPSAAESVTSAVKMPVPAACSMSPSRSTTSRNMSLNSTSTKRPAVSPRNSLRRITTSSRRGRSPSSEPAPQACPAPSTWPKPVISPLSSKRTTCPAA